MITTNQRNRWTQARRVRHQDPYSLSTMLPNPVSQPCPLAGASGTLAVAILNHGELIATAPIEELLAGSDGIVYTIGVKGDAGEAEKRVRREPWVTDVRVIGDADTVTWHVSVSDAGAAESQLLRLLLADERIAVSEFRRKTYELEEVFLNLVEENGDGDR